MAVTFSRAVLYQDSADIETGVSFDPTYRLCDDKSYFEIQGVGEPAHVRVDHIPLLIEWLQAVTVADEEYRAARSTFNDADNQREEGK